MTALYVGGFMWETSEKAEKYKDKISAIASKVLPEGYTYSAYLPSNMWAVFLTISHEGFSIQIPFSFSEIEAAQEDTLGLKILETISDHHLASIKSVSTNTPPTPKKVNKTPTTFNEMYSRGSKKIGKKSPKKFSSLVDAAKLKLKEQKLHESNEILKKLFLEDAAIEDLAKKSINED